MPENLMILNHFKDILS